jgi:hypothetical protein
MKCQNQVARIAKIGTKLIMASNLPAEISQTTATATRANPLRGKATT